MYAFERFIPFKEHNFWYLFESLNGLIQPSYHWSLCLFKDQYLKHTLWRLSCPLNASCDLVILQPSNSFMAITIFHPLKIKCSSFCYHNTKTFHLCLNFTEKVKMIVPDWYNRIVDYTTRYCKTMFYNNNSMKFRFNIIYLLILGNLYKTWPLRFFEVTKTCFFGSVLALYSIRP